MPSAKTEGCPSPSRVRWGLVFETCDPRNLAGDLPRTETTALSLGGGSFLSTTLSYLSSRSERSEGRDLRCAIRVPHIYRSTTTFSFVISQQRGEICGFTQSRKL
jgi:hypothetical protein